MSCASLRPVGAGALRKFGFEPVVLQPANVGRLQRNLPRADISIFEHYPCIVASIDFVKSDRNKPLLLRHPPELVIVDEAHLATRPRGNSSQREQQQRYELVHELAQSPDRNLVLVTATPHSGIEENFRSLIGLLDKSFDLDTARPEYAPSRTRMLPHIIQRPRADVERWLGSDKPFPKRIPSERVYSLSAEYKRLFSDVLGYCQNAVDDSSGLRAAQRRVRYWAAIAMLRSLLSSPRAAEMALSGRAQRIAEKVAAPHESDEQQIDEMYGGQVLEFGESSGDNLPVAAIDDPAAEWSEAEKRRLNDLAHRARELVEKEADAKLHEAVKIALSARCSRTDTVLSFFATTSRPPTTSPNTFSKDWPTSLADSERLLSLAMIPTKSDAKRLNRWESTRFEYWRRPIA